MWGEGIGVHTQQLALELEHDVPYHESASYYISRAVLCAAHNRSKGARLPWSHRPRRPRVYRLEGPAAPETDTLTDREHGCHPVKCGRLRASTSAALAWHDWQRRGERVECCGWRQHSGPCGTPVAGRRRHIFQRWQGRPNIVGCRPRASMPAVRGRQGRNLK